MNYELETSSLVILHHLRGLAYVISIGNVCQTNFLKRPTLRACSNSSSSSKINLMLGFSSKICKYIIWNYEMKRCLTFRNFIVKSSSRCIFKKDILSFELKRSHEHKVIPTRIISITSLHFTPHYCVYICNICCCNVLLSFFLSVPLGVSLSQLRFG